MIKKFNEFNKVNEEWSISDDPERFGQSIIDNCLRSEFITQAEAENTRNKDIATECARRCADMEEIGSSDMTYIMKGFLDDIGKKTEFQDNRLVVVNE
jgi:hypothetical protein